MGDWLTFEIDKQDWQKTRIHTQAVPGELAENEVLLKIDRQALTANNITYAATGDELGYWGFFPTEEPWGRIPAMSWAEVERSAHPEIAVGERVWGSFPISTHLKITAGNVTDASFIDVSPHRAEFPPVYAQIDRASGYPFYEKSREDQDILLRGLFITSWLIEDFLDVNGQFWAEACVITSASSKTSIALAHCVKQRSKLGAIALTSPGNMAFCESLGVYDDVISYDDIEALDNRKPSVLVDMAGNAAIIANIHKHFGDRLLYSCRVGQTHYDEQGENADLPGPTPEYFSAPVHFEERTKEISVEELMAMPVESYAEFRKFCDSWLTMDHHNGPDAVTAAFAQVLAGKADPAKGQIVSMHSGS